MDSPAANFNTTTSADVAWLGTGPIPAAPYYDPEYFELERKAVFMRSWLLIGHVCELPKYGSFIRREVEAAKTSLLIIRGRDNLIRAFYNVCPHRGTELVPESEGTKPAFNCRYHMWTFGTDGALLSAPEFHAFNLAKADCSLHSVRLEIIAGLMFVNFSAQALPLREDLGEFAGQLETLAVANATEFSEYSYEIESNWKLCYDNFQENYHLRFIHALTSEGGRSPENPFGYPTRFRFEGHHRGQTIYYNRDARSAGPVQALAYAKVYEAMTRKGVAPGPYDDEYFALFPSLFMLGTPSQNFSHMMFPISAGRTRGVIRIYWVGEAENASAAFAREYVMTALRDVHAEDIRVIEAGFRGLASGVLKHIHFQTQEALCRHLYFNVTSKVDAYQAELAAAAKS